MASKTSFTKKFVVTVGEADKGGYLQLPCPSDYLLLLGGGFNAFTVDSVRVLGRVSTQSGAPRGNVGVYLTQSPSSEIDLGQEDGSISITAAYGRLRAEGVLRVGFLLAGAVDGGPTQLVERVKDCRSDLFFVGQNSAIWSPQTPLTLSVEPSVDGGVLTCTFVMDFTAVKMSADDLLKAVAVLSDCESN